MKMHKLFKLAICVCGVATLHVTSCVRNDSLQTVTPTRASLECRDFQDGAFESLPFTTLEKSNVKDWIKQTYGASNIKTSDSHDSNTKNWQWSSQNKKYVAIFRNASEKYPKVFILNWISKPTLSEILGCYGIPDTYRTVHGQAAEGRSVGISLYYLKKRIEISGGVLYTGSQPHKIDANFKFDFLAIATQPSEVAQYPTWPSRIEEIIFPTN
jgi:hypothetical protein